MSETAKLLLENFAFYRNDVLDAATLVKNQEKTQEKRQAKNIPQQRKQ